MTDAKVVKKGLICDVCQEEMPFCRCICKAELMKYYQCRHDDTCNFHACIRGRCRCGGWWDFPEEKELLAKHRADELIEVIANFMHDQWSHGMKYIISKSQLFDNNWVMLTANSDRWQRQMNTPYSELSEKEKDSDREWARKLIKLLEENK